MSSRVAVQNSSTRRSSLSREHNGNMEPSCPHRRSTTPGAVDYLAHVGSDGAPHRASASSFDQNMETIHSPANDATNEQISTDNDPGNDNTHWQRLRAECLPNGVDHEAPEIGEIRAATNPMPIQVAQQSQPPAHSTPQESLTNGIGEHTPPPTVSSTFYPSPLTPLPPNPQDHQSQPVQAHSNSTTPQQSSLPTTTAYLPQFDDQRAALPTPSSSPPPHFRPSSAVQAPFPPITSTTSQPHSLSRRSISPNPRRRRLVRWLRLRFRWQRPWPEGWLHGRRAGRRGGERREVRTALEWIRRVGL